ncbi:tectonic-2-like [Carassius auratus]|uniref:Tectonic-2-like n=1 Tax=Carassius auratus TaxID=7957 RepID=A0A6P6MWF3_CARAU|nr:tectonic-2-like [Carassius auratus]
MLPDIKWTCMLPWFPVNHMTETTCSDLLPLQQFQDCTQEVLGLFVTPGPFGGSFSPVPEYHCSAHSSEKDPDWFSFLCVTSTLEQQPLSGTLLQWRDSLSKAHSIIASSADDSSCTSHYLPPGGPNIHQR